jgi:hypothetical protein
MRPEEMTPVRKYKHLCKVSGFSYEHDSVKFYVTIFLDLNSFFDFSLLMSWYCLIAYDAALKGHIKSVYYAILYVGMTRFTSTALVCYKWLFSVYC